MDKELTDRSHEFAAEMSRIDGVVQVLLNGHLLLEEALDRLIELYVHDGAHLEEARLTFRQKVSLARALVPEVGRASGWNVLEAINVLRNDVSHRLDSPERQKKLDRLREAYFREDPPPDLMEKIKGAPDYVLIFAACGYCAGFLAVYESAAKKSRSGPPSGN